MDAAELLIDLPHATAKDSFALPSQQSKVPCGDEIQAVGKISIWISELGMSLATFPLPTAPSFQTQHYRLQADVTYAFEVVYKHVVQPAHLQVDNEGGQHALRVLHSQPLVTSASFFFTIDSLDTSGCLEARWCG